MNSSPSLMSTLVTASVLAAWCTPATAQPVLTLDGSCPGILRAEVSGAPPRHGLSLLFASELGSVRIPYYGYCGGVILGLGRRNLTEAAHGTTDEFGFLALEGVAGSRACGGYLQVLTYPGDPGGCLTSNVVPIE